MGSALLLFAGLGMQAAFFLFAGQSPFPASSPRTVGTGYQREAEPIAADLVTAIRNADAPAIRKLLDNRADVNARDAEGNTLLILASFYTRVDSNYSRNVTYAPILPAVRQSGIHSEFVRASSTPFGP
jgi:hypothetical protein